MLIDLMLLLFLLGWPLKKAEGSIISNQTGMKFGRKVLRVNTHQLMELSLFENGFHDVISCEILLC